MVKRIVKDTTVNGNQVVQGIFSPVLVLCVVPGITDSNISKFSCWHN